MYSDWQYSARRLLTPLAALMRPGHADLPIAGRPSDHDAQADRLESFARPLLLAAFYLQSEPEPDRTAKEFRLRLAEWFRAGLAAGTDPRHPQSWGPDASYHQHHVEMGLMAIALQVGARDLWQPLPESTRRQVGDWFGTARGGGIVNNNHLFMSVHILEFLAWAGQAHRTDAAVITAHLRQLETMHRGDGWFEDGINQAFDHYNAFAFHFYGLMWTRLHGRREPERAARWRAWAGRFVEDYAHCFSARGEHPAFGRSITYRCNGVNVFPLALGVACTDLPPGMLRRLCTRNLDFFLSRPITQEQGVLAPGFTDRFDRIVEPYSAPASPYWAAKAFAALLLPPTHPFWTAPEAPLPAEQPGGFVRVMPTPGWVVRATPEGEVEILNGGSMVGNTQLRYGAWKWSKLSYRTGLHFTYAFPELTAFSFDSALTQELDDGRIFGRHSTVVVEIDATHLGYSYQLGFKTGQVNTGVETFLFWRAGWLLQVHVVRPRQPVRLRCGGFALPLTTPEVARVAEAGGLRASAPDGLTTRLMPLAGFTELAWDARLDDSTERRHVAAPFHATPLAVAPRTEQPTTLAALVWSGRDPGEGQPWTLQDGTCGCWHLTHPQLGHWEIRHWSLAELPTVPEPLPAPSP